VITYLDVSAASISSLDVSNGVITYLDVSAATFNRLDASSVSVPGGVIIADRARIGQDISENFVFITAFRGETVANVRGSNRSDGTLRLGANAVNSSNIVLNADGSTTIQNAVFQNPIRVNNTLSREGPYSMYAYSEYIISTPIERVDGLYSIILESSGSQIINSMNISTMAVSFTDSNDLDDPIKWVLGGAAISPPFTYTTVEVNRTATISLSITVNGLLSIYFSGQDNPDPPLEVYVNYYIIQRF